jgi:hypothetical protein
MTQANAAPPASPEDSSGSDRSAGQASAYRWLVTGHVIAVNPAHAVRGPKHSVKKGKTPVLWCSSPARPASLLEAIKTFYGVLASSVWASVETS